MEYRDIKYLKDSISIFGQGFGVNLLKKAEWLSNKQIIYWGDIDVHGFQILSQLREYFPQTQSCMMDIETFTEFKDLAVTGTDTNLTTFKHLNMEDFNETEITSLLHYLT